MATISSTFSPTAWLSSTSNLSHHNKREAENILTEEQRSNDKETRNEQIQKNEKRQLNASQDKKFAISAINRADVTDIQSIKNLETFLRTSSQPINFTLPATEAPFFYSVAYQEQNRLLCSLLIQESYTIDPQEDGTLSYRLVNHISGYLSHNENTEAKQATLAKRLLKPLGEYGAGEGEKISSSRQRGVIAKWLQCAVLGLPSDKWVLLQLEAAITLNMGKIKDNPLLDHQYLKQKFFQQLNSSNGLAILSPQARTYYQENVLSRVMPSFCLQLKDPDEQIRLESMMVNQPAWGYLHAGAMLLRESGAELNQMSLDDIINTGVLLQTLIVERKLPAEYAHYFKLPALIHQQLKPEYMTDSVEINEQTMSSIYRHYFNELQQANQNNPFFKLNNLLQNWKSRPQLARQQLTAHNIDESWLDNYLYQKSEVAYYNRWGEKPLLPSIDKVFADQNQQIAKLTEQTEKILLPLTFNSIRQSEQKFIEQAGIQMVRARFDANSSLYGVPLPPSARQGRSDSDGLVTRVPESCRYP